MKEKYFLILIAITIFISGTTVFANKGPDPQRAWTDIGSMLINPDAKDLQNIRRNQIELPPGFSFDDRPVYNKDSIIGNITKIIYYNYEREFFWPANEFTLEGVYTDDGSFVLKIGTKIFIFQNGSTDSLAYPNKTPSPNVIDLQLAVTKILGNKIALELHSGQGNYIMSRLCYDVTGRKKEVVFWIHPENYFF